LSSEDKKHSKKLAQTQNLLLVGKTLGSYEVKSEIGHGGMGVVYKAYDKVLNRYVALKIIPPQFASDEQKLKRFLREAKNIAKLSHPSIVPIYYTGNERGINFIAMKYVEGKTLAEVIDQEAPLPPMRALLIAREIAEGLSHAHDLNIVHRDIKPENIMIDKAGAVQIMDFGLARSNFAGEKLTESGIFLGTPEYSAPEQIKSSYADPRSDLYSLGVIFYEMLCRTLPFEADTPYELFQTILHEDYTPVCEINPLVPAVLEGIIDKLLMKEPNKRYQTAQELIDDFETAVNLIEKGAKAETQELPRPKRSVHRERLKFKTKIKTFAFVVQALVFLFLGVLIGRFALNNNSENNPLIHAANTEDKTNKSSDAAEAKNAQALTVLVGYFENKTKTAELYWLKEYLSEFIVSKLTDSKLFSVMKESEIRRYQKDIELLNQKAAKPATLRQIAKRRGVRLYITGSFYVVNNKVRIIAKFEDLKKNKQLADVSVIVNQDNVYAEIDKLILAIFKKVKAFFYPEQI